MLLQCDPTTIYALKRLGRWRGSLARSELTVDEPYNTYVRTGLPPGPDLQPRARVAAAAASLRPTWTTATSSPPATARTSSRADYEEQQRNAARYHEARRAAREERATP